MWAAQMQTLAVCLPKLPWLQQGCASLEQVPGHQQGLWAGAREAVPKLCLESCASSMTMISRDWGGPCAITTSWYVVFPSQGHSLQVCLLTSLSAHRVLMWILLGFDFVAVQGRGKGRLCFLLAQQLRGGLALAQQQPPQNYTAILYGYRAIMFISTEANWSHLKWAWNHLLLV